jgi:mono/diheme cytochrome c family protein
VLTRDHRAPGFPTACAHGNLIGFNYARERRRNATAKARVFLRIRQSTNGTRRFAQLLIKLNTLLAVAVVILATSACSKDSDEKSAASKDPDWERGRAVFIANCVACHNNDPSKDGPIGPAIKGSSKELIEARVLSTSYPPGYKPKRPTKVMPQFPFLKDDLPYLAAYLR